MEHSNDKLALLNPHPRDERITFDEPSHVYSVDGDTSFTSVTTWAKEFYEPFDADKVIDKMQWKINNCPDYAYYGMTKKQIKKQWEDKGKEASSLGTRMHYSIECFYNDSPVDDKSTEYGFFKKFYRRNKHLIAYRTEWRIFHSGIKIAGSIDMVFKLDDGTYAIYDWKRTIKVSYDNPITRWTEYFKEPALSDLPVNDYNKYCIQLNIYKYILETPRYGLKISKMCLGVFHPDSPTGTFQIFEVPSLKKRIHKMVLRRKKEL